MEETQKKLRKRELEKVKGGGKSCCCACAYADSGGSSNAANSSANFDGGLRSPQCDELSPITE